ncbi:hypothetical protein [Methylobacterium sp. E-046]|uniref:hypothetical protein n=1 Tax=Methylobacterium sp. E-046 TaxID=2836576 RepID=UPI001FB88998|nr:hypothetical protein [Methylobacterium sp. E-046]MCJ2099269.1 hypothetical protein [Methylobacterium sp. E-046]
MADRIEEVVRKPLTTPAVRTVGGELIPDDDFVRDTLPALVDTLTNPDGIGSEASRARLELASQAGSVGLALDAADTIQANDSLERMLAHQMATAHTMAMRVAKVLGQELDCAEKYLDPTKRSAACVEVNRLAGAYTRLTGSYQAGMMTLQQMRSGGRQTVVVQHNYVGEGGQAVIGGQQQVGGGGAPRRKRDRG